ncbi:MAG: ABC transporter permease, partial [Planctomycetia bacterium]
IIGIDPKDRSAVGEFHRHLINEENRKEPSFALRDDAKAWRDEHPDRIDPDGVEPSGAIVGYQIATYRGRGMNRDESLIEVGQEVILTTVKAGRKPKPVDFKAVVVDLFKCEMSEYDSNYVFVPLEELQRMRGMGDAVTSIQIKLNDEKDGQAVVDALREQLSPVYFSVQTWEDKQGPLLQAVKVEVAILNIILFFIITVAGFGILAIFFMIVMEKTRDIGILKALGASDRGVMGVFLSYGLVLGVLGCGLGAVSGILFTLYINPIEHFLTRVTGFEIFPRDIYYFKDIPTRLDPWTVVWNIFGALAIAVGASVLPARRAARLRPVEALRYE